jgi:glucose/arabinose dehydrogenase
MSLLACALLGASLLWGAAPADAADTTAWRRAAVEATSARVIAVVLHPDFAANARVYVLWTERVVEADSPDPFAPPLLAQRVDRFVWNGAELVFEHTVLQFEAVDRDAPAGEALAFGADGKLYVAAGSAVDGWRQNLVGAAMPAAETASEMIMRLNDDGSVPADNPLATAAAVVGDETGARFRALYAVRRR